MNHAVDHHSSLSEVPEIVCHASSDLAVRVSTVSCPFERVKSVGLTAFGVITIGGVCASGMYCESDLV